LPSRVGSQELAAVRVVLTAVMPGMLVVPPVMVVVVVALMRLGDYASRQVHDHYTQQNTAQKNTQFRHDESPAHLVGYN
jgi:hypothetical protein